VYCICTGNGTIGFSQKDRNNATTVCACTVPIFTTTTTVNNVRGFPQKNLMLYNDQTIATTIKPTAISPNSKLRYNYNKNNIKVYVFTDNRSVVALPNHVLCFTPSSLYHSHITRRQSIRLLHTRHYRLS